jgi:hypothetical protein
MFLVLALTAAHAAEFTPSPDLGPEEQLVLERLNSIRADPPGWMRAYRAQLDTPQLSGACGEGPEILKPLRRYEPRMPLAPDARLIAAARGHSADMAARGYFGHVSPEGVGPNERIRAQGLGLTASVVEGRSRYSYSPEPGGNQTESLYMAETWSTGERPPLLLRQWQEAVDALVADACVPDRGHREHLLGRTPLGAGDRLVGVGFAVADSAPDRDERWSGWAMKLAITTAVPDDDTFYVLGVAWQDRDGDGWYDAGEGVSGARVEIPELGLFTETASGGGYVLPVRARASGTVRLGEQALPFSIDGANVKLDFPLNQPPS